MPAKAKKEEKAHKLPELGQENYDVWEMHVKHCFYAADWLGMYEASQVPPDADADDKKDAEADAVDCKKAWGTVTRSLNDEMLLKERRPRCPRRGRATVGSYPQLLLPQHCRHKKRPQEKDATLCPRRPRLVRNLLHVAQKHLQEIGRTWLRCQ